MAATCRECGRKVSPQAFSCPGCGAMYPAKPQWDGWGFEYKSKARLFGIPLLHVSLKYRWPNRMPVPARGVIAVGQFACGVVTVAQFGLGLIGIGQFVIAGWALAQFGIARCLIAQFGLFFESGRGQFVREVGEVLGKFF